MFVSAERRCRISADGRAGAASCSCFRYDSGGCGGGSRLMRNESRAECLLLAAVVYAAVGCQRAPVEGNDTSGTVTSTSSTSRAQNSTSRLLVAGDSLRFIEHPENLPAGFPSQI